MPIYEYLCEKCKHEFEAEQRITDAPIRTCPKCRARKVKRLISQTSFVLKGGGWYSDLYSSKTPAKDAGKESAPEAKPAAGSEAAAEKPAAKSESGSGSKEPGSASKKRKKGGRAAA
jgi:putative FmdB family regulatory protein